MAEFPLCRIEGDDCFEFGSIETSPLPRTGDHLVAGPFDNQLYWIVLHVQHLDRIGPRLIVRPFGIRKKTTLVYDGIREHLRLEDLWVHYECARAAGWSGDEKNPPKGLDGEVVVTCALCQKPGSVKECQQVRALIGFRLPGLHG